MSNGVPTLVKNIKHHDPTFMPDRTPEQIAETLKDPAAAGAFYDMLTQRYPEAVDMERDVFVERTTGKKPKKVAIHPDRTAKLAEKIKTNIPEFKGQVTAEQLATSWIDGGDAEQIYRDISEIPGFTDMSFAAFEQLMSKDDEHAPVEAAPEEPEEAPKGFGPRRFPTSLLSIFKGSGSDKQRKIKEPEQFTGDETPLSWGIKKMGNYNDRMKLYDNNPTLAEKGRFRIGNEALGLFEDAAGDAIAYSREKYDLEKGDGAFDEIVNDYHDMLTISAMNPDPEKGRREMLAWLKVNEGRMSDADVANAMNAIRGLSSASRDRALLLKQNPKEAERLLELEVQKATGSKNALEIYGDWNFRVLGRGVKNIGALLRNDYLYNLADEVIERHQRFDNRGAYESYLVDDKGNKVVFDRESRNFMYALDKDGDVIKNYEVDEAMASEARTAELATDFNAMGVLQQTADVLGDLIFDAAVTGGVSKWAGLAGRAKLATTLGVIGSGGLRTQDAALQEALSSGRSSGEAYIDQMVKGLMIGATSLINPIEGQLAATAFKTASGKALTRAIERYSTGKIAWSDMLKELGKGAARSTVGEVVEENVQDHMLERGYNAIVYGHDFNIDPHAIVETTLVSALVGALGGSAANIDALSKSGLMKKSIRTVLDNPDLVDAYLEGVRKVDPGLAAEKAEKITQLTKQIHALKPRTEVIDEVASALVSRNALVDKIEALGSNSPKVVKDRLKKLIEKYDTTIDELLHGKQKEEVVEEAPKEAAPAAEPKTTKEPPKKEVPIPEEAWKLKESTNAREIAGYEAWRNSVLDEKVKDLTPEEQAVFEGAEDPEKTVREQLGDNAGIQKPKPAPIPATAEDFESALLRPGFLTRTDLKKGKKGLLLSKIDAEKSERKGELFYTGEERDQKVKQIRQALIETRDAGGDLAMFKEKLEQLNVRIGIGKDQYLDDTRGEVSIEAYQDAVFSSFLEYKRPKAPEVQSVKVKTKTGTVQFTYNQATDQWEDNKGNVAKGLRLKQIQAKQKEIKADAIAEKLASEDTKLSKAERSFYNENKVAIDQAVKSKQDRKVRKEKAAAKLAEDTAKEISKAAKITPTQATGLANVVARVAANIAKRLGISVAQYRKRLSIAVVEDVGSAVVTSMEARTLSGGSVVVLKQENITGEFKVPPKYLKSVRGLAPNDFWLAKVIAYSDAIDAPGSKLHELGTRDKVLAELQKRLDNMVSDMQNNLGSYVLNDFTDTYINNRIAKAIKDNNVDHRTHWENVRDDRSYRDSVVRAIRAEQEAAIRNNLSYIYGNPDYSPEFQYIVLTDMLRSRYAVDENNNINRDRVSAKDYKTTDSVITEISSAIIPRVYHDYANKGDHFVLGAHLHALKNAPKIDHNKTAIKKYLHKKLPTGTWYKFPKGDDPEAAKHLYELASTSHKYPAAWCTGSSSATAASQLSGGDFYVFVSDSTGDASVAVRYGGSRIAEVRGLGPGQSLLPEDQEALQDIVDNFQDGSSYKDYVEVQKDLIAIRDGSKTIKDLSEEELIKLLTVKDRSYGERDELLKEVRRTVAPGHFRKFGYKPGEVSFESSANIGSKLHIGDFGDYEYFHLRSRVFPQKVVGSVYLGDVESFEGVTFPQTVGGYVDLESATFLEGVVLPQTVGGLLDLQNVTSLEGVTLPQTVGGSLDLQNVTSLEGVTLPQTVGGSLDLRSVTSLEGATLPQTVDGYLNLQKATSLEGVTLPKTVGGNLNLSNATFLEGVTLPQTVGGSLDLQNVTSLEGVTLPETVLGDLFLFNVTSFEGATLPKTVGGTVYLKMIRGPFETLIRKQDDRGAIVMGSESSSILLSKKLADPTTPIHEIIHEYERVLTPDEIAILEQWSGKKYGTAAFSEAFAKGGERYIYEGTSGSLAADTIFKKMKEWFKKVIKNAELYFGDINELNDAVRDIYAAMLTTDVLLPKPTPAKKVKKPQSEVTAEFIEKLADEAEATKNYQLAQKLRDMAFNTRLGVKPSFGNQEKGEAIPQEVLSVIDAFAERAVSEGQKLKLSDIFPNGAPEGITDATVQNRYMLALRKDRGAMVENIGSRVDARLPARELSPQERSVLRKIQNRVRAVPAALGRFAMNKMAKRLTGEQKKAVEILANISKVFNNAQIGIYVHETVESFANGIAGLNPSAQVIEQLALGAQGVYGNGQLHVFINQNNFDATVAIHEAVHPLLIEMMATHKELYAKLLQELVSDPDLFQKYWIDFGWSNYGAGIVPKDAQEAAEILENVDEEALTQLLASETMQKLMENFPKQKKSVREKLQRFLAWLLDALGFTNKAEAIYKYMDSHEMFDGFFDDLSTVDSFATKLAAAIRDGKGIPLRHLFQKNSQVYASKHQEDAERHLEELYRLMDEFYQEFGTAFTRVDAIEQFSNQIAAGYFGNDGVEVVVRAYEETVNGVYTGDHQEEWSRYFSGVSKTASLHGDNAYRREALRKMEESLGISEYSSGTVTTAEMDAMATGQPEFDNIEVSWARAKHLLDGLEVALPPHTERAMGFTLNTMQQRIDELFMELEQIKNIADSEGRTDIYDVSTPQGREFQQKREELSALSYVAEDILRALQLSGTAHGRALAFRSRNTDTPMSKYYRRQLALLVPTMSKTLAKQATSLVDDMFRIEERLAKRLSEASDYRKVRLIAQAERRMRELMRTSGKYSVTLQTIIDKYKNPAKPKASLSEPLFMTTGTTTDMQQFFFDLQVAATVVGRANPTLSVDEIASILVSAYNSAGVAINDVDVYAALVMDSNPEVARSRTAYQVFKQETTKTARAAARLAQMISDFGVTMQERIAEYRKERDDERTAIRASEIFGGSAERNSEFTLIKELIDRIRAQAAAFEISPAEFEWIHRNLSSLESRFETMFRLDYPINEDTVQLMINNARNLADFEKLGKLDAAHAEVDRRIAALSGAATPRERYLAVMALVAPTSQKYPGQQVMDKKYESPQVAKLRRELEDKRKELRRVFEDFHASQKPVSSFFTKTVSTMRAAKTMLDASAVFNQGAAAMRVLIAQGNYRTVVKALKDSWVAGVKEIANNSDKTVEAYEAILNNPIYNVARMAGLALTVPKEGMALAEEYFMDSWFENLGRAAAKVRDKGPLGKSAHIIAQIPLRVKDASESLYVTYLNHLRMAMFENYYNSLVERNKRPSVEELKLIAENINVWTGRASTFLGKEISPNMSAWLWAPRYYAAQIKGMFYLFQSFIKVANVRARRKLNAVMGERTPGIFNDANERALRGDAAMSQKYEALERAYMYNMVNSAKQLLAFGIIQASLYGFMKLSCGKNGGIGWDHTKSTFGKLVCNDEVIDISGGVAYWLRFAAQISDRFAHVYDSSIGTSEGYFGRSNAANIIGRMIETKLTPPLATGKSFITNEDFMGRPVADSPLGAVAKLSYEALTPISVGSIAELWQGTSDIGDVAEKIIKTVLIFHGVNFYVADNSLGSLVVEDVLNEINQQRRDAGKTGLSIAPKPPKEFTKGRDPHTYAEFKKEYAKRLGDYILKRAEAGNNPSEKEIRQESARINKALTEEFKKRHAEGTLR